MKNSKKKKITFIVLISVFATLWVTSLVFFGISMLADTATKSIETWYASKFTEKTLNLYKVSMWSTVITTFALLMTLLAKEFKKKYILK